MDDKIFSISEAAKYLGVFPLTLRNWEKRGLIGSFRTPGGHRRFKKSVLDAIRDMNSSGDRLKRIIEDLEQVIIEDAHRQTIDNVIVNLRDVLGKLKAEDKR